MPASTIDGATLAGFTAFKNHLSYFPHSGSVLPELEDDLSGYEVSKGTPKFGIDQTLPPELVAKLIGVRVRQLAER